MAPIRSTSSFLGGRGLYPPNSGGGTPATGIGTFIIGSTFKVG